MSEKSLRLLAAIGALGVAVGVAGVAPASAAVSPAAAAQSDAMSAAMACAVDDPAAKAALAANTVEALQGYLAANPNGVCREEVLAALIGLIQPAAGPAQPNGPGPSGPATGTDRGRRNGESPGTAVSVY